MASAGWEETASLASYIARANARRGAAAGTGMVSEGLLTWVGTLSAGRGEYDRQPMKVSLITTVRGVGRPAVGEFLRSLAEQTGRPDGVIVVDGGSTDGTLEAFEAARETHGLTVLSEPGANISRGRNVAI